MLKIEYLKVAYNSHDAVTLCKHIKQFYEEDLTLEQAQEIITAAETFCPKCEKTDKDVEEHYSHGVYCGKMCEDCAISGYTDQCGIGRPQGTQADIDEIIEPADYY